MQHHEQNLIVQVLYFVKVLYCRNYEHYDSYCVYCVGRAIGHKIQGNIPGRDIAVILKIFGTRIFTFYLQA